MLLLLLLLLYSIFFSPLLSLFLSLSLFSSTCLTSLCKEEDRRVEIKVSEVSSVALEDSEEATKGHDDGDRLVSVVDELEDLAVHDVLVVVGEGLFLEDRGVVGVGDGGAVGEDGARERDDKFAVLLDGVDVDVDVDKQVHAAALGCAIEPGDLVEPGVVLSLHLECAAEKNCL